LIRTFGTTIQRYKRSNNTNIILPDKCQLILTSSMAAVRGTGQLPLNQKYYTHQDWNTYSDVHNETIKKNANWGTYYQWSKMESERQAWDLCQNQWSDCLTMTALCPSFVFGPLMDATKSSLSSSYSIALVNQWIHGVSPVQSRLFVDVRDVAKAHVMAARNDAAMGQRIIVSTEARISSQDIAQWIKEEIFRYNLPIGVVDPDQVHYDGTFQGGSIPIGTKEVEATEMLQNILGITLRPVQDTIVDMTRILLSTSESK
jgi:nucleoside-diphosphate-sugar epimerase